jgi:hypothetical protein
MLTNFLGTGSRQPLNAPFLTHHFKQFSTLLL